MGFGGEKDVRRVPTAIISVYRELNVEVITYEGTSIIASGAF